MFRLGRSRINADLFAEIACALDGDPGTADRWRERAVQAMSTRTVPTPRVPTPGVPTSAVPTPALSSPAGAPQTDPAHLGVPGPATPSRPLVPVGSRVAKMAVLIGAGLLLNATGKFFNPLLGDVLFIDMVGTALVALLAGPWAAVAVGVLFIGFELAKGNPADALFAITMVLAGIIWGYGVHRYHLGRTLPRFLALSAVVAVSVSALAVPITVLYLGGVTGRGLDGLHDMISGGDSTHLWAAVTGVNLTISLVDKVLTGALAYFAVRLIYPSAAAFHDGSGAGIRRR